MNIQSARLSVKAMSLERKNMVRKDVEKMIILREKHSPIEIVKCSAPTSFITERCFKKGIDINPEEILALL